MMENVVPKRKLGILTPLPVIGSSAYEYYCMAPPGVLLEMIPIGLREFTRAGVERALAPLDEWIDMFVDRRVDLIMQSGIPVGLLLGIEAHDVLIERIAARSGKPATSSMLAVPAAARNVGITKVVAANRWPKENNATLARFFEREGIEMVGVASEAIPPSKMQKMPLAEGIELAYQIGRRALETHPEADGLYIGGSRWMVQESAERLEREFGKPVVGNKNAMVWDTLRRVDYWTPMPNQGRVLGAP